MSDEGRRDRLKRRLQRARTAGGGSFRLRSHRSGGNEGAELEEELETEADAGEQLASDDELAEESDAGWGDRPLLGDLGPSDRRRDRLRRRLASRKTSPRQSDRQRRRPSMPRRLPRPLPRPRRPSAPSGRAGAALAGAGGILRGAGSGAARGLRAGGRGLRGGADHVAVTWGRTSLVARRRIAALIALAALVALFAFVLVPNAPCSFPGGDRCPPSDDAITLVPDNALVYLHANVDEEDEQFKTAGELAGRLPQLSLDVASSVPVLGQLAVDFPERVDPWAAEEIAVAFFPDGLSTSQVALIEVADPEGARTYAEDQLAAGTTDSTLNGVTITSDPAGMAFAEVEGYLAIGDRAAVGAVVRVGAGELEPLSETTVASELLDGLPERELLSAYVSDLGLGIAERSGALGAFDTFVDSSASQGVAVSVAVSSSDLELTVSSDLDPKQVEDNPGVLSTLPNFEPALPGQVGADALALLTIGDAKASISTLLSQATTGAPDLLQGLRRFVRRLQAGTGADVEDGLLGVLGSETALTVEPPTTGDEEGEEAGTPGVEAQPQTPYLGLLAREVDEGAAKETLAGLQSQIAAAVDPSAGQAPSFSTEEIDGIEAQVLDISGAVELAYGFSGDTLIAGSSPVAIERFASGDSSLADDDRYQAAVVDFPEQLGLLVYFDLEGLIRLGEAAGLATDPGFASRAPDLRQLRGAALAVSDSDQELRTELRLTLGDAAPSPAPLEPEALPAP